VQVVAAVGSKLDPRRSGVGQAERPRDLARIRERVLPARADRQHAVLVVVGHVGLGFEERVRLAAGLVAALDHNIGLGEAARDIAVPEVQLGAQVAAGVELRGAGLKRQLRVGQRRQHPVLDPDSSRARRARASLSAATVATASPR